MSVSSKIISDITQYIANNRQLFALDTQDSPERQFARREIFMGELQDLLAQIPEIVQKVVITLDKATAAKNRDLSGRTKEDEWILVERKKKPKAVQLQEQLCKPRLAERRPLPVALPGETKDQVMITPGISVAALRVGSFTEVMQDGELYYVEPADHFAVNIMGHIIHGNIGTVYIHERAPVRVKDCGARAACVGRRCSYYHDPEKFPGSKDRRNFFANEFPKGTGKAYTRGSHIYGSLPDLHLELMQPRESDLTRVRNHIMHNFLYSLLLAERLNH